MIETIIELKEDVNYEVDGVVYEIKCPDGFIGQLRRTLSNNCIEMQLWAHLGASVTVVNETKSKTTIKIPGVRIYSKGDKNTIAFLSEDKPHAMTTWNGAGGLREFLKSKGIQYKKPKCIDFIQKKTDPDCFNDSNILKTQ